MIPKEEEQAVTAGEQGPQRQQGPSVELEQQPFDSLEYANLARDRRSVSPLEDEEEEDPRIFINTQGEWVVGDKEEEAKAEEESRVSTTMTTMTSSTVVVETTTVVQEPSEEDDIPDDWKETSAEVLPLRRCVPVVTADMKEDGDSSSSSGSEAEDGRDSSGILEPAQTLMSVIVEVDEEKTGSCSEGEHEHLQQRKEEARINEQHLQHAMAAASSQQQHQQVPSSFTQIVVTREEREERISPDTVTSNDSGILDTHDEVFSPNEINNASNINVKGIAKFWEEQKIKKEQEEEAEELRRQEEKNLEDSKMRWFSMPDLKNKMRKHSSMDEEHAAIAEQQEQAVLISAVPAHAGYNSSSSSSSSSSGEDENTHSSSAPPIVRHGEDLDDRDVCTLVPIRERMKLFETLAAHAQMEKKKQWSSMPSLEHMAQRNKDNYQRYTSSYSRKNSAHQLKPTAVASSSIPEHNTVENKRQVVQQQQQPLQPQVSYERKISHQNAGPLALVSATSREDEDFELTPLKDRMRLFTAQAKPVSKPVVSVPKTVSPSVRKEQPIVQHSAQVQMSSTTTTQQQHHQPSLELPSHPQEDELASLTDSVASSNTSSSTVISASKINGFQHSSISNNNNNISSSSNHHSSNSLATYSWNDESNGEIYNDKIDTAVKDKAAVLYVVENGKEFPLTSVSKRKSFFQSQDALNFNEPTVMTPANKNTSKSLLKMPTDIMRSEPLILDQKQTKLVREQQQAQDHHHVYDCEYSHHRDSVSSSASASGSSQSGDFNNDEFDQIMRENGIESASKQKETIKSAKVPYIEEEQAVLQNINLVKAMKEKVLH